MYYLCRSTVSNNYNLVIVVQIWKQNVTNNERDGVSNHQPHDCLPNRLFRPRNAQNVSIWWRHHEKDALPCLLFPAS